MSYKLNLSSMQGRVFILPQVLREFEEDMLFKFETFGVFVLL